MNLASSQPSEPVPPGLAAIIEVHHRRLALLRRISTTGGVTVADLADTFGLTLAAVRLHLARLSRAGLVEEDRLPSTRPGRPRNRYRTTAEGEELLAARALLEQLSDFSPTPHS